MANLSEATREIMWNIPSLLPLYVLLFITLLIFGYGVYQRVSLWKRGKSHDERFSQLSKRLWIMIQAALFQKKVFKSLYPGVFHGFFFYSVVILFITTAVIGMDYDFGTSLFKGKIYVILTIASETAGCLILIGVIMALWRRHVVKPKTLETTYADTGWLLFLALIVITGFLVEGSRITVAGDQWPWLSLVGYLTSVLLTTCPFDFGITGHSILWWLHILLVLVWIAAIPYTKFFHILVLPANAFLIKLKPAGELSRIDFDALMESKDFDEEAFTVGISSTGDFSWKQRMDLDACVSCGRCEAICPAFMADQPLSPKKFICSMRDLVRHAEVDWKYSRHKEVDIREIVNHAFDENFIWLCRTCLACVAVCPSYIEHMDTLIEIRRNEVGMKGRLPIQASNALKTMESLGNPFGPQNERINWVNTLDIPVVGPGESTDVIYWMGCFTTLDPTKQRIATDLCQMLKKFDIEFGVLGEGERCCGDPARVMGEEYLFQTIAKEQVVELNKRKFNTLLVSCPHGYTVLKNEYPQFGGNYNVVHYTEYLYEMFQNRLRYRTNGEKRVVTYHDPCYLGRYQHIYEAPRKLICAIPGITLVEMKNHKTESLCCGGGGGHFWMDIKVGERINNLRVKQALAAGADTIVTACPFCLHMLEDAVKQMDLDNKIQVIDIIGLLNAYSRV